MNSRLSTYTKVLSWLLMGVSIIITVLFFLSDQNVDSLQSFIVWTYFLFGISVLSALLFPIINFIRNPKNAVRSFIGLGAIALVFLIGYLASDATALPSPTQNPDLSNPTILVVSDTGLIATYLLFGLAFLLLLYTGLRSIFNKY